MKRIRKLSIDILNTELITNYDLIVIPFIHNGDIKKYNIINVNKTIKSMKEGDIKISHSNKYNIDVLLAKLPLVFNKRIEHYYNNILDIIKLNNYKNIIIINNYSIDYIDYYSLMRTRDIYNLLSLKIRENDYNIDMIIENLNHYD